MSVCSPEALDLVLRSAGENKMGVINLILILNVSFFEERNCSHMHGTFKRVVDCVRACFAGAELSGGGGVFTRWSGGPSVWLLEGSCFVPSPSAFVHTQCKSPDPIGTRKLNHCRPC